MKLKKIISLIINRTQRQSSCSEQVLSVEGRELSHPTVIRKDILLFIKGTISQHPRALCTTITNTNICKLSSKLSKLKKFGSQSYNLPGVNIKRSFYNVNESILINMELSLILILILIKPTFFIYKFIKIFDYEWKISGVLLRKRGLWKRGKKSITENLLYFNFYYIIPYILTLTALNLTTFKKYKA